MSVDLFIRGIKPADDKHAKMLAIYRLCKESNIQIPQDVHDYFVGTVPNEMGVIINHYDLPIECRIEFNRPYESGYLIDLCCLPKDVRYLEVYLS